MKKFVVLGPESTGKSFLCAQLAEYFHSQWVPEFAREYLATYGPAYQFDDLYEIAIGQLKAEEMVTALHPLPSTLHPLPLFIDTDLYTIKIWSEIAFNRCDNRILSRIASSEYDGYLLCNPDLPWAPDPLREYPDLAMRQKIYHFYKDALLNQDNPWTDVTGNYEERFNTAADFTKLLLSEK